MPINPREHKRDFHCKNRDIHISTFSKAGAFRFVLVNHTFGTTITYGAIRKAESDEYQWQQCNTPPQGCQVNRNISVNGMKNQPSMPRGSIDKIWQGASKDM
jgi:hypothetical protein